MLMSNHSVQSNQKPIFYLDESTTYSMATLLVFFMAGSMIFDPQEDLQVLFNTDHKKVLLEADSCFNRIVIPT